MTLDPKRDCYECLNDGIPEGATLPVVGQGLCRTHLAWEYAEEARAEAQAEAAYYDMLATEQEVAMDYPDEPYDYDLDMEMS